MNHDEGEMTEKREQSGMPLWGIFGALLGVWVGAVAFLAELLFVFAPEAYPGWLRWVGYLGGATALCVLVLALRIARRSKRT